MRIIFLVYKERCVFGLYHVGFQTFMLWFSMKVFDFLLHEDNINYFIKL